MNKITFFVSVSTILVITTQAYAMGLRSFVALPVEKGGSVARLTVDKDDDTQVNTFTTNIAYGIDAKQTLLMGLPYRLSPAGTNRLGDISLLYRRIIKQEDKGSGTDRFGWLGGIVAPTTSASEAAIQTGIVYTHFKDRHEVDADALYQVGTGGRVDRGRYDVSWQYRLSPSERSDWGINPEWNSVLELNGRWQEGTALTHQLTAGLQWIHQKWVLEGGVAKDLNNTNSLRYLISTRFHF